MLLVRFIWVTQLYLYYRYSTVRTVPYVRTLILHFVFEEIDYVKLICSSVLHVLRLVVLFELLFCYEFSQLVTVHHFYLKIFAEFFFIIFVIHSHFFSFFSYFRYFLSSIWQSLLSCTFIFFCGIFFVVNCHH